MARSITLRSLFFVMALLALRSMPVTAQVESDRGDASLLLYPNPNKGDQVHVLLGGLDPAIREVALDMYDMKGAMAMRRMLTVNQGGVDLVLDLYPELPNGMYLVNITVGSQQLSQRLVIARQ